MLFEEKSPVHTVQGPDQWHRINHTWTLQLIDRNGLVANSVIMLQHISRQKCCAVISVKTVVQQVRLIIVVSKKIKTNVPNSTNKDGFKIF